MMLYNEACRSIDCNVHKYQLSADASANQLELVSVRLSFLLSFSFAIALLDGAKIGPQ